jgi:type IV pilus assembly protein PilA
MRRASATRPAEHGEDEGGFTLIELMIVIGIIAVLLSVAMPTFLGSRSKAQDRAAQADLRVGLTAIRTAYIDGQSYVTAAAQLASVEPTLTYLTGPGASSAGNGQIAVNAVDDENVGMSALAADGVCWQLFDSTASGTTYGSAPHRTSATCQAPGSPLPATSW